MPRLETHIEAILFYSAEPTTVGTLARLLECSSHDVEAALEELRTGLLDRGIRLVRSGECVELRTAGEAATVIEKLRQDELSRDISRASLETLSLVLYEGPVTRAEIEYVRGVQSQSSLRALSVRGLIEKITERDGKRGVYYVPTTEALAYLGVSRAEELPSYQEVRAQVQTRAEAEMDRSP